MSRVRELSTLKKDEVNVMGVKRLFFCKNCYFRYGEKVGCNIPYNMAVQRSLRMAKNGELGQEVQDFINDCPDGVIDCLMAGYYCPACGRLKSMLNNNMYLPKKDENGVPIGPGNDKIRTPWELRRYYYMIRKYEHLCDVCGHQMRKLGPRTIPTCPRCNTLLSLEE